MRIQLVASAAAALVVLLAATALSVYKPMGMTPYGRRKQQEELMVPQPVHEAGTGTRWGRYVLFGIIGLVVLFIILHLLGGGLRGH